jgi:hypothetical protein
MLIGTAVWVMEDLLTIGSSVVRGLFLFGLNLVLAYLIFFIVDRGHVVRGSMAQPEAVH